MSTPPAAATGDAGGPRVRIHRARLRETFALVRLYRGQSAEARAYYHPFPFDPPRVYPIFLWMIATTPFVRWFLRHLPMRAAYVVTVRVEGDDRPVGYGTVRFAVEPDGEPWAKFGYMVAGDRQGQGIGSWLSYTQLRVARGLGVRRGGGYIVQQNLASRGVVAKFGQPMTPTAPDRHAPQGSVNLMSVGDLEAMVAAFETKEAGRTKPGAARLVGYDAQVAALAGPSRIPGCP